MQLKGKDAAYYVHQEGDCQIGGGTAEDHNEHSRPDAGQNL